MARLTPESLCRAKARKAARRARWADADAVARRLEAHGVTDVRYYSTQGLTLTVADLARLLDLADQAAG